MKVYKGIFLAAVFTTTSAATFAETLKMAVNIPAMPFVYHDGSGEIIGYEVDLINKIGELKGFDVEIISVTFPQVFEQLEKKEVDFISRIYYSEERDSKYNLTNPHYLETLEFIKLKENDKVSDPIKDDVKVSVLNFSPLEAELREIEKSHANIQDVPVETSFLSFKAIFTKKADMVLSTKSIDYYFMKNYPDFEYVVYPVPGEFNQEIPISFLMLKANTELLERLNSGLASLEESGYLEELKLKYHM